MNWFSRLTHSPQQSWKRFKIAVGLFVLAVILILGGARYSPLLQIPGLLILATALFLAIWGYLGILAHRLTSFKSQHQSTHKKH